MCFDGKINIFFSYTHHFCGYKLHENAFFQILSVQNDDVWEIFAYFAMC